MKTIDITEQTLIQIRQILLADDVVRRLLFIQTPSALTADIQILQTDVETLIIMSPYIEEDTGVANSYGSNFIVIYPSAFDFSTGLSNTVTFSIDIFVHKDYLELDGAKLRLLQLLKRVVTLLHNKKMAFAEKMQINNAMITNIDRGRTIGYLTSWFISNEA